MISVPEIWDSREGTTGESASTDLRYIIRGTDYDTVARLCSSFTHFPAINGQILA